MARSNGKRVRRWLWIGAVAAGDRRGAFGVGGPRASPAEVKDKVKTAKAEVADVQVRVTEVGSVEPDVKVDVKSVLSGKVVELLVREGDRVRRGQVLARVEPDVNQARDLAQVKNSVSEAEIALGEARATYERNRDLLAQGLLSAQAGPRERDPLPPGEGRRDSAMDKYRIVQESGVPIASVEAGSIQRLNVASPMDGVVIRRPVELGDTVMSGVSSFNAGTVLMTVADVNTMIIEAGVNEVDIGKVRLGQPVKVTLDAYPKVRFDGKILRIAPAARLDEKVKVFDVDIAIDRQGAELRTGMTANIDIAGERREKVLTVPVEAIFKKDETEVVYVRSPRSRRLRPSGAACSPGVFAAGRRTPRPPSPTRRTPGRRSSSWWRSRPVSPRWTGSRS
jgi:HlyD family secretion protein